MKTRLYVIILLSSLFLTSCSAPTKPLPTFEPNVSLKRLYILPGYGSSPRDNWFQWLKNKAELEGFKVTVIKFPARFKPNKDDWVNALQRSITHKPDENTYFISHSLGCITLLRYIEKSADIKKLGGFILVSGFLRPAPEWSDWDVEFVNGFTKDPINYKRLKNITPNKVVIRSKNDGICPPRMTKELAKNLNARLITTNLGGHFTHFEGYRRFPLVLNELRKIMLNKSK